MGTQGVPFDTPISDISNTLIKYHGCVAKAAKELNVARKTLYAKINSEPDLQAVLKDARDDLDELEAFASENSLLRLVNNGKEDPANSLKAAIYILDNKGKHLGYGAKQEASVDAREGAFHSTVQIDAENRGKDSD